MASSATKEKSGIYIQYTSFRHNDDITVVSFNNSDNFSDERKKEISDYIKKLVELDADIFLFTAGVSLKYNVGVSIRGGNNVKTQFLISEKDNS